MNKIRKRIIKNNGDYFKSVKIQYEVIHYLKLWSVSKDVFLKKIKWISSPKTRKLLSFINNLINIRIQQNKIESKKTILLKKVQLELRANKEIKSIRSYMSHQMLMKNKRLLNKRVRNCKKEIRRQGHILYCIKNDETLSDFNLCRNNSLMIEFPSLYHNFVYNVNVNLLMKEWLLSVHFDGELDYTSVELLNDNIHEIDGMKDLVSFYTRNDGISISFRITDLFYLKEDVLNSIVLLIYRMEEEKQTQRKLFQYIKNLKLNFCGVDNLCHKDFDKTQSELMKVLTIMEESILFLLNEKPKEMPDLLSFSQGYSASSYYWLMNFNQSQTLYHNLLNDYFDKEKIEIKELPDYEQRKKLKQLRKNFYHILVNNYDFQMNQWLEILMNKSLMYGIVDLFHLDKNQYDDVYLYFQLKHSVNERFFHNPINWTDDYIEHHKNVQNFMFYISVYVMYCRLPLFARNMFVKMFVESNIDFGAILANMVNPKPMVIKR